MDLITIILVVGSLINGVLLTLCLRNSRTAAEECQFARKSIQLVELDTHRLACQLDTAIAALPKKRKPRAKVESDVTAS